MTFAGDGGRPPLAHYRYLDLDGCILLGPDATLMRAGRETPDEGSFVCSARSLHERWLLELYTDNEHPVRVLIAGEEECLRNE